MAGSSKSGEKPKRKPATSRLVLHDIGMPSLVTSQIFEHMLKELHRKPRFDSDPKIVGTQVDFVVSATLDGKAREKLQRYMDLHGLALHHRLGFESMRGRLKRRGDAPAPPAAAEPPESPLDQALAAARARGALRVAEILSANDMLSGEAFAARLGVTRATVNSWRQAGRVLGLAGAKRGYRYPAWQIGSDGAPFAILPQLHDRFGQGSWAVYRFLVQAHPELDGATGRDMLARGAADAVLTAAESVAQGFA